MLENFVKFNPFHIDAGPTFADPAPSWFQLDDGAAQSCVGFRSGKARIACIARPLLPGVRTAVATQRA